MPRDTGIANRLRARGVAVVEVADWQTRGSSDFTPRGGVNHHTAGPSTGIVPSLSTVIDGRPDLAGPLANVLQSRETSGLDVAYVVAAGRANHAGSGGWAGLSGNSSVYGLEIEHDGVTPLPAHRIDTAARILAALIDGTADAGMVCQHFEWAPGRKIDAAQGVSADGFRASVATYLAAPLPEPDPEDDPMARYPIDLVAGSPLANGLVPFWRLTGPDGGIQAWNGAPFHGSLPWLGIARSDVVGIIARDDRAGYVLTVSEADPTTGQSPTFAFPL